MGILINSQQAVKNHMNLSFPCVYVSHNYIGSNLWSLAGGETNTTVMNKTDGLHPDHSVIHVDCLVDQLLLKGS